MISKRQRRLIAKELFTKPEGQFEQIDISIARTIPPGMTRAFRNNRYTVMIFDHAKTTHGEAIQALVQKVDDTPIAFHWREMQRIKNEIFGEETTAIEYYPAQSKLLDTHNIYWLWIYPAGILPIPIR